MLQIKKKKENLTVSFFKSVQITADQTSLYPDFMNTHTYTQHTHTHNLFVYPTSLSKISTDRNKDNLSQPVYTWMSFLPKFAKKKKSNE